MVHYLYLGLFTGIFKCLPSDHHLTSIADIEQTSPFFPLVITLVYSPYVTWSGLILAPHPIVLWYVKWCGAPAAPATPSLHAVTAGHVVTAFQQPVSSQTQPSNITHLLRAVTTKIISSTKPFDEASEILTKPGLLESLHSVECGQDEGPCTLQYMDEVDDSTMIWPSFKEHKYKSRV